MGEKTFQDILGNLCLLLSLGISLWGVMNDCDRLVDIFGKIQIWKS